MVPPPSYRLLSNDKRAGQYHLALEDTEAAMEIVHPEDEVVDPLKATGGSKTTRRAKYAC